VRQRDPVDRCRVCGKPIDNHGPIQLARCLTAWIRPGKTIAALAITATALLSAPGTAHADPAPCVNPDGTTHCSSDAPAYQEVCRMLDTGASPDTVANTIARNNGGGSANLDAAHLMIMVAIHNYCPKYTAEQPHWDWTN
jgi:hypothetical protein